MQIIGSDFDNTIYFLDDDKKNKKNIRKIKEFISKGNKFIIITGRNYSDIKYFLNEYKIPYNYLVCDDGAKIFDENDVCLNTIRLGYNTINEIIPILEKENADYYLDDGYSENNNKKECVKIVINCVDKKEKEKMIEIVKHSDIHIYASRFHVNIINRKVNKEMALRELFKIEKLDYGLLNVIGDNDNDYKMLKAFNGGVIKKHNEVLDELNKEEYETLAEFIDKVIEKDGKKNGD